MPTLPFKRLLSRLPRLSHLVRRREFIEASSRLGAVGRVRVEGLGVTRSRDGWRTQVVASDPVGNWAITKSGPQIAVAPCWVKIPGYGEAVFPLIGGRDIRDGGRLVGTQGFVCLEIMMRQKPRRMVHDTYSFPPDPAPPIKELTADCVVLLREENTVEVAGIPQIILTQSERGTSSVMDANNFSATFGRYLIPLGYVAEGRIVQFIQAPMQITLRASFLNVSLLD